MTLQTLFPRLKILSLPDCTAFSRMFDRRLHDFQAHGKPNLSEVPLQL